jgi:hypothetical protein
MTNADALMVFYYVVLSGVLVFTLGYFRRLAPRQEKAIMAVTVASCSRTSSSR